MLIQLLVVLIVVGLVLYLVKTLPIDERIKAVITVVAVLIVIVWLLGAIGVVPVGSWRWR